MFSFTCSSSTVWVMPKCTNVTFETGKSTCPAQSSCWFLIYKYWTHPGLKKKNPKGHKLVLPVGSLGFKAKLVKKKKVPKVVRVVLAVVPHWGCATCTVNNALNTENYQKRKLEKKEKGDRKKSTQTTRL